MSSARKSNIAVLIFGLTFPTLITWVYFILLARDSAAVQQTAFSIGKAVQFTLPMVWVFWIRREKFVWTAQSWRGVFEGIASGLIVGGLIIAAYHLWMKPAGYFTQASSLIVDKVAGIGLLSLWGYLAMAVFYSLAHSLLEEYYWRWFIFRELRTLASLAPAVLWSSIGFMAHHVLVVGSYFGWLSPLTILFSLSVAIGGAYWAWLYERSQSIVGPWISHLLIDATIFVVGYDILVSAGALG